MNKLDKLNYNLLIITIVAFTCILLGGSIVATVGQPVKSYPEGFIPLWESQDGGRESLLLNVETVTRVEPVYDNDDRRLKDCDELKVYFSDGSHITVSEEYDEFMSRLKAAQR